MDTVIEEPDRFYIIEFKFGGTAESAIEQIKKRRYSDKFNQDKPINALGIAVDCETKAISQWVLVSGPDCISGSATTCFPVQL